MKANISAKELANKYILTVNIIGKDQWIIRLWIGQLLIRLAAWIMWFEIEWIDD